MTFQRKAQRLHLMPFREYMCHAQHVHLSQMCFVELLQVPFSKQLDKEMSVSTKRKGCSFPMKLFKILWDADQGHHHRDVIAWLPDGKAFKIYSERKFRDHIMGRYFTQTNFKSFTRQLYLYGFLKMSSPDPDTGVFYHPRFIRSDPQGCVTIKRNQFEGDRRLSKMRVPGEGVHKKSKNLQEDWSPRTSPSVSKADEYSLVGTCFALSQADLSPASPTAVTTRSASFLNKSLWSDGYHHYQEFMPITKILDEACLLTEEGDLPLQTIASCAPEESITMDDLFTEIQSTFTSSNQGLEIDDLILEPRPIEEMIRLPIFK